MNHEYTESQLRACRALQHAAEQVASTAYRKHNQGKRKPICPVPSQELRDLIAASSAVLAGTISVESAMAMVTQPEIMKQRFGG